MIQKIKQNPREFLGVVAGILFLASIMMMFLTGLSISSITEKENLFNASLFALTFGGTIRYGSIDVQFTRFTSMVNPLNLISFILLVFAFVGVCVLIYGLLTKKISKKIILILTFTIIVCSIVCAILTFLCKNSALHSCVEGIARSFAKETGIIEEEAIQELINTQLELIKNFVKNGSISITLGVGAIISPIMAILGAASTGGVIYLTLKKNN